MASRIPHALGWSILALALLISRPTLARAEKPAAHPPTAPAVATAPHTFPDLIHRQITHILDQAAEDNNFDAAAQAMNACFDQVIAYGEQSDGRLFRQADEARRLLDQLRSIPPDHRVELLAYLRAHPYLEGALVFLVKPQFDDVPAVYALLDRLRQERGQILPRFANLAAALCVVQDGKPFTQQINENRTTSPDPLALFDYYTSNESRMLFGLREVPPELLVYVVDSTASIADMQWALAHYAGTANIGPLFFSIKYDFNNLRTGAPKKVTELGYTLPNILAYGGVCADQAYFATTVGKAIGVPTAYDWAISGEAGHAWVGFLQARGGHPFWNFNSGRYQAYQDIRGNVTDPQTRRLIPDSYVSLLAELSTSSAEDRQAAEAFTDAVDRLETLATRRAALQAAPLPQAATLQQHVNQPRTASAPDQLALLEAGLRRCAGYAPGWFAVRNMAAAGRLSLAQKQRWAALVQRLCGTRYPDFMLAVLEPMIQTVTQTPQQNQLWNAAFAAVRRRPDLAAQVRMDQARMWEQAGDLANAGQCYEDIIDRFANDGPFVIPALVGASRILQQMNQPDKVIALYEKAWLRTRRPSERIFAGYAQAANWYRVGMLLLDKLQAANRPEAAQVKAKLEAYLAGG